jgi:hypothetical protein
MCRFSKHCAVRRDSEMGVWTAWLPVGSGVAIRVPVAPQGECERREGCHAASNPYRARYNRLKFYLHAPSTG